MQRGDPLVVGRIIGDVVDPFVRRVPLRVAYAAREISNGCELRPSAIADQPRVEVGGPDMRTFYTLVRTPTTAVLSVIHSFTASRIKIISTARPAPS
jgi:protein FLOWERING LOCUS T